MPPRADTPPTPPPEPTPDGSTRSDAAVGPPDMRVRAGETWASGWSPSDLPADPARSDSAAVIGLVGAALVVAMLHYGQDIFVPLGVAALLAFVLDPVVSALRRRHLPRGLAVGLVMVVTALLLAGLSLFVARQVAALGSELPTYEANIQLKLRHLRQQLTSGGGTLDRASRMLDKVNGEFEATRRALAHDSPASRAPMKVQVEPNPPTALQSIMQTAAPVVGPLSTAGLVMLLLVFLLLERNDLRDRMLRLVGGDLHRSTDALDEAAQRVSRFLTVQLLINASYAVPLGLGLWLVGVPGALLWGVLGGLLRFVPYVGPLIAAVAPLTLAFAVDPGWQMLAWTLGVILLLELVVNNLVEPWLYGHSTGLAPSAVLLSALFWTVLWGPVGLILATPLTVCLVVMGRHIPRLQWMNLLLSSSPALSPSTRLYQRLVAGAAEEAIDLALQHAARSSPRDFYASAGIPALRFAASEQSASASVAHRHRLASGMATLLRDLREEHVAAVDDRPPEVVVVGGRWEIDALSAQMLAHAMALEGTAAKALPPSAIAAERITELRLDTVQVLCLTYFHGDPTSHARYVCRRLRRLHPALRILLVCWQSDTPQADPGTARALGADALAVTLDEALMQLRAWAGPDADTARALVANAVTDTAGGGPATGAPATGSADAPLRLAALDMALRAPFDHAAQRAADVFGMPLALVGLFDGDRVTWVGRAGALDERLWPATWPRQGPCDEVKASGSTLVVPDLQRDPRFVQPGPWHEAGLRYYAAAPLRVGAPPAPPVGTLCLLDTRPRQLSAAELGLLATMADELSSLLRANVDSVYEASASMTSAKPDARATDDAPPAPTGGQGASSTGVAWPPGGVPA